jgi:hypothetical protein
MDPAAGRSDPKAWQAAVEAFSYGHVYEVARCRWRLAEALLSTGDREQATTAAQAAYQTSVRLGAEPLQAALELLARRGRLDLGVGLAAERGLAGLTPRELEVLPPTDRYAAIFDGDSVASANQRCTNRLRGNGPSPGRVMRGPMPYAPQVDFAVRTGGE